MKAIPVSNPIFSGCRLRHNRRYSQTKSFVVNARRGANNRRNIVDENMIVLRMRIREMEMDGLPPARSENWMEWEKNYYEHYIGDVCEAMRMVQMCLMNNRTSLVLGILTVLMLIVTLSVSDVIYDFISLVKLL
ncbi:hypothetical protein L1987_66229 [Smallanthus sonchifolius]|uniref:Uncharacterized protein n=1 Tax=Smallanthus sonchifolius TaxID=185202 RepID=A0ACB9BWW1_9ASTR|nr:hypothetical protein L1987_66229 [Smallanthus sonchifolius]